jgi:hypothetical protein
MPVIVFRDKPSYGCRLNVYVNVRLNAVVGGLEWSKDPESYAGGSEASLAGQVDGDDPD